MKKILFTIVVMVSMTLFNVTYANAENVSYTYASVQTEDETQYSAYIIKIYSNDELNSMFYQKAAEELSKEGCLGGIIYVDTKIYYEDGYCCYHVYYDNLTNAKHAARILSSLLRWFGTTGYVTVTGCNSVPNTNAY